MQNNSVHVKNDEETRPVPVIDLFELWEFFWNVKKKKKKKKAENNVHLPAFLSVEIIHREISD